MITKDFTGAELDTLIALVENGPVWDGDLPSKSGRDTLVQMGFAICTVVKGECGYQVVTESGLKAYLNYFEADKVSEAIENRKKKLAALLT